MLQGRPELTGIVPSAGFEPPGEPAMERPPRLVRETSERSLAQQIVRRPEHTSALHSEAAARELSCCTLDAPRRPALARTARRRGAPGDARRGRGAAPSEA